MAKTIVTVDQGGTGAETLTDGGILLGSGVGAVTATAVLADGEMLVGDGTTDPAVESGATLRTSIDVDVAGTDNSTPVTLASVTGNYLSLSTQEITAGTVPLTLGGTGATTAGAALTALGGASSGANSDITSVTGLTTALTAAQGGTGNAVYVVGDILYADTTTSLSRLAASTDGYVLTATGAGAAPAWEASAGGGNVSNVATPVDNQVAIWKTSTTIEGDADLVFDGSNLGIGGTPSEKIHVTGDSGRLRFDDAAGTEGARMGLLGSGSGLINLMDGSDGSTKITLRADGGDCYIIGHDFGVGVAAPSGTFDVSGKFVVTSTGRVTVKDASNCEVDSITSTGASVAIELNNSDNFKHTMTEATTLANPTSTPVAGQSGCIVITQDSGGNGWTMAYGSQWHFEGGTDPTLSTAANAVDNLVYYVASTTSIHAVLLKDLK